MSWLTSLFSWLFAQHDNSKLIAQIQAATVKACGFLPYAEVVGNLLSANPSWIAATVVAQKICGAVNAPKTMWLGAMNSEERKPSIDGVIIEGEWVK